MENQQERAERKSARLLWVGILLAILAVAIVLGVVVGGEYTTEQKVTRTFTIEEDFTKVRKIMVRTNAAKEIVTMGGDSEFVDQQWRDANVETGGENIGEALLNSIFTADPDWKLELDGTLRVRTLDEYIGQNVITLEQHVEIAPNGIESQVELLEGSERLLGYSMSTRITRDGEKTKVELELTQKIKTDAPWFAHGIADRRVRASAERAMENQEGAMRRLIEENADKAGLFPLR
jgi:hypothetical protein